MRAVMIERTVDLGQVELKRMVEEGNVASAIESVAELKPLELRSLAWDDSEWGTERFLVRCETLESRSDFKT